MKNKNMLQFGVFLGVALVLWAAALLGIILWKHTLGVEYKGSYTHKGSGISWRSWLPPLLGGVSVWIFSWRQLHYRYLEVVERAEVLGKDFRVEGGLFYTESRHTLTIRGKNRAGEIITSVIDVSAGDFERCRIGGTVKR